MFVTPELERAVGLGLAEDGTTKLAFSEALDCDGILPRNIIVVFQIDPTVPADCALALIAVVQWALDVSLEAGSQVRVITLTTDDGCDFVSTLVALGARDVVVDHLDLGEPWDGASLSPGSVRTTMHSSTDAMETVQTIAAASLQDTTTQHLILSFRDVGLLGEYERLVVTAETPFVESGDEAQELIFVLRAPTAGYTWLTINPALSLIPLQFHGYGGIHILLGQCHRAASTIQQMDFEGGASLSATVGSTAVYQVLACFIRYPSRIRAMRERLKIQRVITSTAANLKGTEEVVFMRVLPLLNYDHRLAFFVALDSDDMVRRVKIQLAAIISTDV
ncbi:hypothetical protein FOCG_10475 [Fusarium oxysporum f. sp. radicis-lycopersici 26381]|nr:hypothetical protein FOCG_10475 [Fusarium oxysporum f. sp. radicis-lycopersici 26381]